MCLIIDSLDGNTALVLVNAVYFKGNWENQFNAEHTRLGDFHVDENTTKQVPMMFRNGRYNNGMLEELDASYIELPYQVHKKNNIRLFFLLLLFSADL